MFDFTLDGMNFLARQIENFTGIPVIVACVKTVQRAAGAREIDIRVSAVNSITAASMETAAEMILELALNDPKACDCEHCSRVTDRVKRALAILGEAQNDVKPAGAIH